MIACSNVRIRQRARTAGQSQASASATHGEVAMMLLSLLTTALRAMSATRGAVLQIYLCALIPTSLATSPNTAKVRRNAGARSTGWQQQASLL
jgi:hypothetical protein